MSTRGAARGRIIETERLYLRELKFEDAERLALVLSDPAAMRFYPAPFSRDKVEQWIGWNIDNYARYGFGLWAVALQTNDVLIGDCGITMQEIEGELVPEIGYHIIGEYCGKGYASEAAKACISFAFEKRGFDRVVSYMKEDNGPSRRVAE
ncbi:GNAT family N-acetyltransferase [Treponema zuelzerae]|uniref:GNAT family N-acetyltransferase n=1 Tax=Teretinema zuelzerae TaxID=156 RepID=A0AAE3EFK6_9SPIR|nr:GNAT family N-acetyltransferase [Teretinema zuelzerae]MCD1653754.1 GNAT family N-acetyltransferase [Teretinema zuelzerae]